MSGEPLRKVITGPAKPITPTPLAPPQMAPVRNIPLSREDIEQALSQMTNTERAELLVSVVLRNKIGRKF